MEILSVKLSKLIKEFSLSVLYAPEDLDAREIMSRDVLRPGMQLATGFFSDFDNERISILGKMEHAYLEKQEPEKRLLLLDRLFAAGIPCLLITRNLEVFPEILAVAEKHKVPVLRTEHETSSFIAALIAALNIHLAPRITRHGVLVEVYGEGILLLGESGVGKSETAMELIKRGHRLIADDNVIIKEIANELYGTAPEIIRYFMELRGIGIINVKSMYGSGSVLDEKNIQLIIQLENWQQGKEYDRVGNESSFATYFGIKVPKITIPVSPGRNLAIIIEVAARNFRLKSMGYDASEELITRSIGR